MYGIWWLDTLVVIGFLTVPSMLILPFLPDPTELRLQWRLRNTSDPL